MKKRSTHVCEIRPHDFAPRIEIAAIYLAHGDNLLFLRRAHDRPEGRVWGVPGGGVEQGESPEEAAYRELHEETGIILPQQSLICAGELYIRKHRVDYVYHAFYTTLETCPSVIISHEHIDYAWVDEPTLTKLPLLGGAHDAWLWYKRKKQS